MSGSPYAQPAPNDPYRARTPGPGFSGMAGGVRVLYTVLVAIGGVGFFATVGLWSAAIMVDPDRPNEAALGVGVLVLAAVILALYAQIFTGVYWLYRAWSWLPPDQRYARNWRSWITPSQAAWMLIIPYFGYYWMFLVNTALCDALDRLRVTYPTQDAAPKNLAIAAGVCQLLIPMPVGAILWLVYMSRVEKITRDMAAASGPRLAGLV